MSLVRHRHSTGHSTGHRKGTWGRSIIFTLLPPPPCKALFLVTMAKRQRNISLRGMGLLSPWVGKETKQHFFEGVGSQAWTKALGLGAYTHAHLKPAKLYSKLKGSANSGAPWGLAVADTPI